MTTSNESVVRKVFELIEMNDGGNVGQYFSANWVNHDPSLPPMRGLEGAKLLISFWNGLTNKRFSLEDSLSHEDRVAIRFALTGMHNGELMGIAPTGKQVIVSGIGIFKVVEGKVTDNWVTFDTLGLLQQLGAAPRPG